MTPLAIANAENWLSSFWGDAVAVWRLRFLAGSYYDVKKSTETEQAMSGVATTGAALYILHLLLLRVHEDGHTHNQHVEQDMSSPSEVKALDPDSFSLISAMTDAKTLEQVLVARKQAQFSDVEGPEGRKRRYRWIKSGGRHPSRLAHSELS